MMMKNKIKQKKKSDINIKKIKQKKKKQLITMIYNMLFKKCFSILQNTTTESVLQIQLTQIEKYTIFGCKLHLDSKNYNKIM